MAYVIAEPCIGVKDTACLEVCPVDCIQPGKGAEQFAAAPQLYIDPENCICCALCVTVCPVAAIFHQEDLPEKWRSFISTNADHFNPRRFQQPD